MAVKELFFRYGGLHMLKMSVYFWIIHNWHKNNDAIMAVEELFFRFWGITHAQNVSVFVEHNWHKNNVAIMAVEELFFRFWGLYMH